MAANSTEAVAKKLTLPRWHYLALAAVLALAIWLHFYRLGQEGYGNLYYAAAVKSMLTNWHNFFFASFDPGGFVTVDKPPLGLWVQAASAALLGLSGFSLALPQALAGVLSVLLLYYLVRRVFGPTAGLLAALVLAVTPISIAANRNNTMDSQLVLTSLLAAWAVILAAEKGKSRYLLLGFLLVGVGFNIKMLQAYMILPAFYLLYLFAPPLAQHSLSAWWKRILHLGPATVVMIIVSLSWTVIVDSIPIDERPYIGSSEDNTVMELIVGHNGVRRLGEIAGWVGLNAPGPRPSRYAPPAGQPPQGAQPPQGGQYPGQSTQGAQPNQPRGMLRDETGEPGPLRLFNEQLGGQASWLLPLALLGLFVAPWGVRFSKPLAREHQALLFWGAWLVPMIIFFNWAGLFHRYYLEMMSPAIAALVSAGLVAMWKDYASGRWRGWILPLALLGSAAIQVAILGYFPDWGRWLSPIILGVTIIAALALIVLRLVVWQSPLVTRHLSLVTRHLSLVTRHLSPAVTSVAVLALLIAPTVWATTPLWKGGHTGLPFAGPELLEQPPRPGGEADPELVDFLLTNRDGEKFILATLNAQIAAPFILATGEAVMAMGGFTGSDEILSVEELAAMVEQGEVRFFLLQGSPGGQGPGQSLQGQIPPQYPGGKLPGQPQQGQNPPQQAGQQSELTQWISETCRQVDPSEWGPGRQQGGGPDGNMQLPALAQLQVFDCGEEGRESVPTESLPPATATPAAPSQPTPPFNPFAAMTSEQEACLRQAWGEEALQAITTFQRPPTENENPAMGQCGLLPPAGAGGPGGTPPPGGPGAGDQGGGMPSSGPYAHQVMFATSADGLNWQVSEEIIRDHGSVPEIIRLPDGTLLIYFVDGTADDTRAIRRTTDGSWEEATLTISNRPTVKAWDPDAVLLPDGSVRLFYFGSPKMTGSMNELHTIYSATSQDGLTFVADSGERITVNNVTDPSVVILPDGTWLMALSRGPETLLASSAAGGTFTETGVVVSLGGVPELTVLPDNTLRLYVSGQGGIRSLLSTNNGQTWKEENGVRVNAQQGNVAADPSVIRLEDGSWMMVWKRVDPEKLK